MRRNNLDITKVTGFGSDGARAMTGLGEGVAGYLLRENPMIVAVHCVAHRLALCSSQAARDIPALKEFTEDISGVFYYFKSSVRVERLAAVQELLEDPKIRVKEVHDVRWLAIYKAVEVFFKCYDSLLTFFGECKDAKGQGYKTKLATYKFIATVYMFMDVLTWVCALSLVFQRSDLNASRASLEVDNLLEKLEKFKSGHYENTYTAQFEKDVTQDGDRMLYKGTHVISSKGKNTFGNTREKFINNLIANLNDRFPRADTSVLSALCVLGLRPVFC